MADSQHKISGRIDVIGGIGFYLGFIAWGKRLEWEKAMSFLGGLGACPTPPEIFKMNMR